MSFERQMEISFARSIDEIIPTCKIEWLREG